MRHAPRLVLLMSLLAAGLSGACSKELTIGAVISETGAVAPYGSQVKRGIDLALEELNAAGGFKGKPIRLAYRDDATNAAQGREAVEDLVDNEGARIIIGAISSAVTLEIAPICEKKRVLLLSPTASAPQISEAGEFVFRNYPSDVLEGTAMADFARKTGVRRVVIIALDNEFGNGLSEVFSRGFESKSREIVETFRIAEDPATFPPLIAQVQQLNPEAIYIVAYVDVVAALLEQLRAAGSQALLMGSGSVIDRLTQEAGDAAEHFVYAQPTFDPASSEPAVRSFVEAFRAKYEREPDIFAAHGYDALKLIVEATRNARVAVPDEVRSGLHGLHDYQGAAGRTQFDERGDVVRYPTIFVIQGGAPVPFDRFEQQGGTLPIPLTTG